MSKPTWLEHEEAAESWLERAESIYDDKNLPRSWAGTAASIADAHATLALIRMPRE